jgi:flagellar hook-associated protein 1
VNALTSAIAQLDSPIEAASTTPGAGTLEDLRQQDIGQLSQLIGINQITVDGTGLSITTTAGQLLVSKSSSFQLTSGTVSGSTHFFVGTTDVTSELAGGGGELGGYLTARDGDIPNVLGSLDQLAYNVSSKVNALNNAGSDLSGDNANAGNIFSQPAQVAGAAAQMSVEMTDPNHIAAASFGHGAGDNSNAMAIANLANRQIVNGQKPTDFFSNFVTSLGAVISRVEAENTAQNASVTQLETQNNALSTVNLNDEAAFMQQFERSYQAASQVFTMLDKIMASAMNLGQSTAVS